MKKNIVILLIICFIISPLFSTNSEQKTVSGNESAQRTKLYFSIFEFNTTSTDDPKTAKAYFKRDNGKKNSKDFSGAIKDYDTAIKLSPKNFPIHRIEVIPRHYPSPSVQPGRVSLTAKRNPDLAEIYNNRGLCRYYLGDFKDALEDLNEAILLNEDMSGAYNNRGLVKGSLNDQIGAIDDFRIALEIDSDFAEAYNNRGLAENFTGQFTKAIEDFNNAIRLNSKSADSYYGRAYAKHKSGDSPGAKKDLEIAGDLGMKKAYEMIEIINKE